MSKHSNLSSDLTKNQSLVFGTLSAAQAPLTAYTILHELREHGLKAPLQIYRALDKLVELGLVHRLESLNAFVACQHPSCERQENSTVMFTICEKCGNVRELLNDNLVSRFTQLANDIDFALKESVIELRGVCAHCRSETA